MNIERVQAYFAEWNGLSRGSEHSLAFDDSGARGHFGGLNLYSAFQPLVGATHGEIAAHEALLRPRDANGNPLSPMMVFGVLDSGNEIVYFDRLCRMVHAVNFVHLGDTRGDLFLNVDFRHLLSVKSGDHGREFEGLLHHCGLQPQQIILEVLEARIDDLTLLDEAVTTYRQRGFRIAIDDFGAQDSNFDRLWRLTPDIVKIDRELIVQATDNPRARRILPKIVEIIHDLGAQVVCEGIETAEQHALACDSGADLLQGFLYGRPTTLPMAPDANTAPWFVLPGARPLFPHAIYAR